MSQMLYWHVFDGYEAMASICKIFNYSLFCWVHKTLDFLQNTCLQTYSHNFRIFQATGFQNIGKMNAILNEILIS